MINFKYNQTSMGQNKSNPFYNYVQKQATEEENSLKASQKKAKAMANTVEVTVDEKGRKTFTGHSAISVAQASVDYAKSMETKRAKDEADQMNVKKVRYNYKGISSQLIKSKTSANASQIVGKAKREVQRLKKLRSDEKYDQDEVLAALTHAQSMERIARKKQRHLLEEEMAKAGNSENRLDYLEDEDLKEIEAEDDELEKEEISSEESEDSLEDIELQEMPESISSILAESDEGLLSMDSIDEMTMEELTDSMKDLLEETGLSDLMDTLEPFKTDLDSDDIKMMKLKHRLKEMKEMVKADNDYLKTTFENMEKKGAGVYMAPATNVAADFSSIGGQMSAGVNVDLAL